MKKSATSPQRIGIIGGGQLARMMTMKAHDMGLEVMVMSDKSTDPAAQVTPHWFKGSAKNAKDLKKLLQSSDITTFESEFIDGSLVENTRRPLRAKVSPKPLIMKTLQDRWTQKNWLVSGKLATAPFCKIESIEELEIAFKKLGPLVLKRRRFGYDGYGTYMCRNKKELKSIVTDLNFKADEFIGEAFVPFQRELAISLARNAKNEFAVMPLVESLQKDSKCFWIKGPVAHQKLKRLIDKIKAQLKKSNYVGLITFELFDTGKELLINEVAPRVHNSAHHSLDSLYDDQFTLHLKAILGLPLKDPQAKPGGFAMVNLIGSSTKPPRWQWPTDAHLHWYGKAENRPGRKMGHINSLGKDANSALKLALKSLKGFDL